MKRMYVTLSLILIVLVWAITSLGQKVTQEDPPPEFDQLKRRMELREEMHRRMRSKLLQGFGPDEDLFKDMEQMFEDALSDSWAAPSVSSNFSTEWIAGENGRTLIITPRDKGQQLNIDVNPHMITITGKTDQKSAGTSVSSSFKNSFSVPVDCDGTKVKMNHKDGKIFIELPYKLSDSAPTPRREQKRRPLPRSEGDVSI